VEPLIVEVAINGGRAKHPNPAVPIGVDEIVADACACIEAGATVGHHHNGDSILAAAHDADPYRQAWRRVREKHPNAILYPTMGSGGHHTSIEERYAHVETLANEGVLSLAIIDPGSVNIAPLDAAGVPLAVDFVYQNSYADIEYMSRVCLHHGIAAHVSIFEPGFLAAMLAWRRAGRFPFAKVQLYFCGPELCFGLPPTLRGLDAYLEMLEGSGLAWMVGVLGGDCAAAPVAEAAIRRGGHVRVGLEDYFGDRHPRNADLVGEIAQMSRRLGRPLATADDAARLLQVSR
jgi:3-keto-5-aminohexanoate cleavage enzyme